MVWWWAVLIGIEVGWALGAWRLLAGRPLVNAGGLAWADGSQERRQEVYLWAYFLYHLPLALLELLFGREESGLLEGQGLGLLVEAAIIGAVTVALYGAALASILQGSPA